MNKRLGPLQRRTLTQKYKPLRNLCALHPSQSPLHEPPQWVFVFHRHQSSCTIWPNASCQLYFVSEWSVSAIGLEWKWLQLFTTVEIWAFLPFSYFVGRKNTKFWYLWFSTNCVARFVGLDVFDNSRERCRSKISCSSWTQNYLASNRRYDKNGFTIKQIKFIVQYKICGKMSNTSEKSIIKWYGFC